MNMGKILSDANPLDEIVDLETAASAMSDQIRQEIDDEIIANLHKLVADAYEEDMQDVVGNNAIPAITAQPFTAEHHVDKSYVDKSYLDGQVFMDTNNNNNILINDGNDWVSAKIEPVMSFMNCGDGPMTINATGLNVNTPDGEVDVLAKIEQLERKIVELEKNGSALQSQRQISKILYQDPDLTSFDKAMKGV